jgi:tetraacyldisaccharide 4'-kinase
VNAAGGSQVSDSPLPPWLADTIGPFAARIYASVLAARNTKFDLGKGVVTFDRPVISIGNLTVGGTGKTPMVSWVIARLRSAGWDPCIAMRGYRAVHGISDEAAEYAASFSDLPIISQPNRIDGLIRLFGSARGEGVDAIVLDDGLQHRQIARQADVVLIDARWNLDQAKLLPHGWYREGPHALSRASAVVLMHADRVSGADLKTQISRVRARCHDGVPIATARHAWRCVDLFGPGDKVLQSTKPGWVRGKRLALIAAIARPEQFIHQVEAATGHKVVETVVLRDHDPVPREAIQRLGNSGVDGVIMTGKDWAKVVGTAPHHLSDNQNRGKPLDADLEAALGLQLSVPIVVPRVEIQMLEEEEGVWGTVEGALAQAAALSGGAEGADDGGDVAAGSV